MIKESMKRIGKWCLSLAFEIFALCFTFLLRPFVSFLKDKEEGRGRPILLVHGYLQNGSNWIFLKNELRRKGFGPIYTLNLSRPFHSIQDHAKTVAKKVEEIAKETNRKDLCLVGHSMGGLVTSWYALTMALPDTVSEIITIGSPLHGTHIAAIALGQNGREMRRGSDFVQKLQSAMQQNLKKTRFYHIASKTDQLVLPWRSAVTGSDPTKECVLDGIGHMSLLFSRKVSKQLQIWLGGDKQ